MNTTFTSPAEGAPAPVQTAAPASPAAVMPIRVWDAPVRVFHWLAAASFAGAYLTAESERWRLVHVSLGYTLLGLVVFRLVWGLLGTRHARFASFVRGPAAVKRYLLSLLRGRPEHHTGHNPAGALAILCILGLAAAVGVTGWATYNDLWGGWTEELHEGAANAMLALVGLHVAAVLLASRLHGENLIKAMVTGFKRGAPLEAITRTWRGVAALLLVAALGLAWLPWLPSREAASGTLVPSPGVSRQSSEDD